MEEDFSKLPKSQKEAKELGSVFYFTGKPCNKRGHIWKRLTKGTHCVLCKKIDHQEFRNNNREDYKKQRKESYLRHKEHVDAKKLEWSRANTHKKKITSKIYREKNKERLNEQLKHKYHTDLKFRLGRSVSRNVRRFLKEGKANRRWETLVNFTVEELVTYLEQQFRDGMTWENYGPHWHIDHIKPISKCETLEEAMALSNHQPLLVWENLSKHDKYEE